MPANWTGFETAMNSWFCGDAEGGDVTTDGSKTAKKIADEYETAILLSAGPQNNIYANGLQKALIESGFNTSFKAQMQAAGAPPEGIDMGSPVWTAAANGVVNAWATATFQAMPATGHGLAILPLTGGPTDHQLLDPGLAGLLPLTQAIYSAFHTEDCSLIGGELASGFADHMSLINGMYFGLMPALPSPTPVPQPPVPWVGVT